MTGRDSTDILELLERLPRFADRGAAAYQPGLERMRHLLALLGDPQEAYEIVHVAGTNGKGSTASMVAAIARAAGRTTGLHTSPHLFHVAERMRVNGIPASTTWLSEQVPTVERVLEEVAPSYFELTVGLSLLFFAEQDVDLAVVEVGMGGRLDATNTLMPSLAIITEIGLDHTAFLGDTLEKIAREKAGIIKSNIPVVTSARSPALGEIEAAADHRSAPFHDVRREVSMRLREVSLRHSCVRMETPLRPYDDVSIALPGRHQLWNAATAVRAAELALPEVREDADVVSVGLRDVRALSGVRGRFEILQEHPLVVADVAHNPEGLSTLLEHLQACRPPNGGLTVLLGVMRDKDVEAMGSLLHGVGALVQPVSVRSERGLPPAELASKLEVFGVTVGEPTTVQEGLRAFLSVASHSDTLVITGSHLVVAELESAVS